MKLIIIAVPDNVKDKTVANALNKAFNELKIVSKLNILQPTDIECVNKEDIVEEVDRKYIDTLHNIIKVVSAGKILDASKFEFSLMVNIAKGKIEMNILKYISEYTPNTITLEYLKTTALTAIISIIKDVYGNLK